jgi:hypothetical protein
MDLSDQSKISGDLQDIITDDDVKIVSRLCDEARQLWLSSKNCDIQHVQEIYTKLWNRVINRSLQDDLTGDHEDSENNESKPQKRSKFELDARGTDDNSVNPKNTVLQYSNDTDSFNNLRLKVGEKLALLLLQTGQTSAADKILHELGYKCRLATSLFNYCTLERKGSRSEPISKSSSLQLPIDSIPCRIFQNLLSIDETHMLRDVFLDPSNSYWNDHNYQVEPPSDYFSYLIPLTNNVPNVENDGNNYSNAYGMIGIMTRRIQLFLAKKWKAVVQDATYCEMWAHNRPHATGHQFHFDSDNEGIGTTIRNPICSCVIYLTADDTGGPSVITNQRLLSRSPADKCWLCFPDLIQYQDVNTSKNIANPDSVNVCVFDGNVLHGVMPGKPLAQSPRSEKDADATCINSSEDNETATITTTKPTLQTISNGRRVTVMFAFWRRIRLRDIGDDGKLYGAARLLPSQPLWSQQLRRHLDSNSSNHDDDGTNTIATIINPIHHDRVYETIGGTPWTRKMGMLEYHEIFQGF